MQKKLKKVAVTIGFKADNTPIKKAFYGRSTAQAKSRAERWLESHGTPEKQADILTPVSYTHLTLPTTPYV